MREVVKISLGGIVHIRTICPVEAMKVADVFRGCILQPSSPSLSSLFPSLVQARNVLVKGDLVGAVDMDLDEIVKAIDRLEVSPLSGERIWIELLIAN